MFPLEIVDKLILEIVKFYSKTVAGNVVAQTLQNTIVTWFWWENFNE